VFYPTRRTLSHPNSTPSDKLHSDNKTRKIQIPMSFFRTELISIEIDMINNVFRFPAQKQPTMTFCQHAIQQLTADRVKNMEIRD
jgi:hypothetical protein